MSKMQNPTYSEWIKSTAKMVGAHAASVLGRALPHVEEDTPQGSLARGIVFELTGGADMALKCYEDAHARLADSFEPLARITIVLLKLGRKEEALQRAIELAGTDPCFVVKSLGFGEEYTPMTLLADALLINGRTDDAIEAYTKALQIKPDDVYSGGRLAALNLAMGNVKEALSHQQLFADSPRFRDLDSTLRLAATSPRLRPASTVESVRNWVTNVPVGRPLVENGKPVRAAVPPPTTAVPWLHAALDEHASIAAFARLTLQLLGVGAPPALLRRCIDAMGEELEHAELSLDLHRTASGDMSVIGALDVSGVLQGEHDPARILRETLVDACIGETLSAREAAVAAEWLEDPAPRDAFARIARDEARHSELAWDLVDWLATRTPEASEIIDDVLTQVVDSARQLGAAEVTARHLPPAMACELRRRVLDEEIAPRLAALLARTRSASSAN